MNIKKESVNHFGKLFFCFIFACADMGDFIQAAIFG